ncbi:hypothetical protein NBRC10512_000996 [Rhodotorula toruloides]|uniref:Sodium/hydrogen exchanger n=2 Tax=Rhodotorula toruloides TaxID=5286 RepID=A0A061BKE5_RHOTO|nr:monovalent inorganic cation transporter [Rhodotorula toruloides NP11]EMS20512.1 monovalent inorganic cation transporter [Rhodotorula toruloides NP11]CDR48410.1 RHTO0S17e02982g1_1 [Rhodotorula toruloides]
MNNPNGGIPLPSPTPPASSPLDDIELDPEVQELWSSRALLLVLLLLILSFWVSYYLKVRRIRSIHETIVAMFSGMCVGALVRLAPGHVVQDMIAFKSTILLNVLLPPIILNSGYQLKQENFFRNFAVILSFAFAGTFISAVVLGVIVYLYSLLGLEGLSLTIIECLLFGSTLSATDPVTILAIFNAHHVDPKLYSVIFGESILNDAVAIVMFETLSQFHGEKIHLLSFFHGTGIFLLTFFISMALGVIFGLSCSLMLKHSELGRYTEIEACLVLLIAYTSYFFSNAMSMSGIVSLLFCGITLKHYAYHNMSRSSQRATRAIFGILASLAENFIFIYLGLSLFTQTQLVYKPIFILVTAFAVCVARYCAVFPISKVINVVFRARGARTDELPHSYQMMLFWAGLRGAVGVALAEGMKGEHAVALRTTVLVTVVLTVVVFGGTIQRMIEILGIRTGVEEELSDSEDEEGVYNLVNSDGADVEARRMKRRSLPLGVGGGGVSATSHHFASQGNGRLSTGDFDQSTSPYRDQQPRRGSAGRLGAARVPSPRRPQVYVASDNSASSEDSDPDVLPSPSDPLAADPSASSAQLLPGGGLGQVWSALDEQYLLPVFSNTTANRHERSKKMAARAKKSSFAVDRVGLEGDEEGGEGMYAGGAGRNKSFSDIVTALVAPALSSSQGPSTPAPPTPAFASPNSPYPSIDLTAAASSRSLDTRPAPRARSSGSQPHTPTGSAGSLGGPAIPVQPFGGRRGSAMQPGEGYELSGGSSGGTDGRR